MSIDGVYIRLRALCCAHWGMTPGEFERASVAGDIGIEDVIETFFYASSEPFLGTRIHPWVFREREKSKAATLAKAKVLFMRLQAAQGDPERKAKIEAELVDLQKVK